MLECFNERRWRTDRGNAEDGANLRTLMALRCPSHQSFDLPPEDGRPRETVCECSASRRACAKYEELGGADRPITRLHVHQPHSIDLRVELGQQDRARRHAELQ
ncbi:MAG: hypothetical protein ACK58T_06670, partial [Phycisphaerae bacterium]